MCLSNIVFPSLMAGFFGVGKIELILFNTGLWNALQLAPVQAILLVDT